MNEYFRSKVHDIMPELIDAGNCALSSTDDEDLFCDINVILSLAERLRRLAEERQFELMEDEQRKHDNDLLRDMLPVSRY